MTSFPIIDIVLIVLAKVRIIRILRLGRCSLLGWAKNSHLLPALDCRRRENGLSFAFKISRDVCLPYLPVRRGGDDIVPFNYGFAIPKLLHKPEKLAVNKLGVPLVVNRLN